MTTDVNISSIVPEEEGLPPTGERFLPGKMFGDIELEHLHRYFLAMKLASGRVVLDIASGEGYGTNMLAGVSSSVIGVDISEDAVAYAKCRYFRDNLEFRVGDCSAIPVADHSVDLVVSFETLEHHDRHDEMFLEIKRVLKHDGILVMSTPDKRQYTDVVGVNNPFHVKELYKEEFGRLLDKYFSHKKLLGQRLYFGSVVAPAGTSEGDFLTISGNVDGISSQVGVVAPLYWLALASDAHVPRLPVSIFDGTDDFLANFKSILSELHESRARLWHVTRRLEGTLGSVYWRVTFPLRWLRKCARSWLGV